MNVCSKNGTIQYTEQLKKKSSKKINGLIENLPSCSKVFAHEQLKMPNL